jgi:hypothetical protein
MRWTWTALVALVIGSAYDDRGGDVVPDGDALDASPELDAGPPDASPPDAGPLDAGEIDDAGAPADAAPDAAMVIPPPPTLGMQLARRGRAAVKETMIGTFVPDAATQAAMRDAYDRASNPADWRETELLPGGVTIEGELRANFAIFDAVDRDLLLTDRTLTGCGNALRYSPPPGPATSYLGAAVIFADDQLYIDTARPACGVYLDLEIEHASAGDLAHASCGGRTPSRDAIDVTYSVLAAGLDALDRQADFAGRITDGAPVHQDIQETTFPFLGPPH